MLRGERPETVLVGYDPEITVDAAWSLPSQVKKAGSVAEILKAAHFVTLHVPQVAATRHLIAATTLGQMRHGAVLLNFSREGVVDEAARERLLQGVSIDGQPCAFKSIEDGGGEGANRWYRVVLTEGRNREVRRMFEAVGLLVSRLMRVRYGPVLLSPRLKRGQCRDLEPAEVQELLKLLPPERKGAPSGAADHHSDGLHGFEGEGDADGDQFDLQEK